MKLTLQAIVVACAIGTSSLWTSTRVEAQISQKAVQGVVDHICSDGGEWLRCYSLEPHRCQEITASYVKPCIDRTLGNGEIDQGDLTAVDMIQNLLRCLNHDFMAKYGPGKLDTVECTEPPQHLQ